MMRITTALWLAALSLVIAGCGGGSNSGGGGGGTTKTTPTVSAWPTASSIIYGQTLASSTLSGGTASVSGSFSWSSSTTAPGVGTPSEGVTFTPTDTTDYNTVAGSVSVTVNKATPTVSVWPTATAISYGQTLASSTLSGGTASVPGTFTWTTPTTAPSAGMQSESVTFTPTDMTDYNTVTGSVSLTVNAVAAPAVTAVTPTNLSTDVAITSAVTATFNEAMDLSTITGSTFTLTGPGNTAVQGTVAYNNQVATFTPVANLAYNTVYTATLSSSIMSSGEVALAAPDIWSFTTTTAPVPTVTTTVPVSGATGVNVANALMATFSQPMNSATLTGSTFTLTGPGNAPVTGLISYNTGTSTVSFTPSASLAYNTSYTATITTGAQSAAGAALASNYVWTFTTGASPNQVTVDFGTTYQTIRGFGGSTAWLGEMPSTVATALFSPTNGLGLSILRVRIDPTGSASSTPYPWETSSPSDGGNWLEEAANGAEAVAANSNAIVFASPWTPPAAWKLSGTSTTVSGTTFNEAFNASCGEGAGYCGGYLDPNHYADYASYLEDFVHFFNTTNSFNLYAVSMQNEPEENVTYESCVWTPQQMDTWIAGNAATITSDTYSTKLIMPESDSFNPVDALTTLNDTNAQGLVSIIGGHLYGVQPTPYSIPSGDSPKELWMTEFGPLSNATLTWSQALTTYGESIHNSMVNGQYNAYVWWGAFGATTGSCATAAGTCGLVDDAGTVQPMGYVMGQYSKFIQPGFVRVSATAIPVAGVYVSAYSNASPAHYVIVAINSNTTSESLSFVLSNGSGVTSLTPYQSTSSAGLAAQTAITISSGQFSYTLPAQSIVTFYQ